MDLEEDGPGILYQIFKIVCGTTDTCPSMLRSSFTIIIISFL